ncbi:hypothetical protein Pcinc_035595 [Petrolisthes cinctipes]|uniref:Uncharacterized protein n=1 Tax=Petrolisthes cinctipes TaxID=88211 RepID=A0AAE1C0J4_PETCI|nr:hypothetical protein Pcinc_035595 [Petrolisthes cinctipes]
MSHHQLSCPPSPTLSLHPPSLPSHSTPLPYPLTPSPFPALSLHPPSLPSHFTPLPCPLTSHPFPALSLHTPSSPSPLLSWTMDGAGECACVCVVDWPFHSSLRARRWLRPVPQVVVVA